MIRNIQLRHAGKYTCAVQTKVDSISIAADLVVRGEPRPFPLDSLFCFALQLETTTDQITSVFLAVK